MKDLKRETAVTARKDREAPSAIAVEGWRFHHVGIPTQTPRPSEQYLPHLKLHVSGYEFSPCGVQWMRFDSDAPYPEIVKTVAGGHGLNDSS